MVDVVSVAVRSRMMAGIRGKDTVPEILVRRQLFAAGFRFRLHRKDLPGRPDIVLPKYNAAVFVHGCFWHRHANCVLATKPKSNSHFWAEKFDQNVARDERNALRIAEAGWRTAVVWECVITGSGLPHSEFMKLSSWLRSGRASLEIG